MEMVGVFRRHIALPAEHGSWGFFLSPLLIGLVAGGRWSSVSLYLVIAALCAFLVRHPIALIVKAHSGRRSRDMLPAAWFWTGAYTLVGLLHVAGLVLRGFAYVLYLGIPGVFIVAWYLLLIRRRAERRQLGLELLASGALALSAAAAFWVGVGGPDPLGWWLWILAWAQSAAGIVHAYLRLAQRALERVPGWAARLRMGRGDLLLATANVALALILCTVGVAPPLIYLAYVLQWLEVVWGISRPGVGLKPPAIGYRQLGVHALFTGLFILAWRA